MILVDTSIWIDHLRSADARLQGLLEAEAVLMHPFVLGELALGRLRQRSALLLEFAKLEKAVVARDAEVMALIDSGELAGSGLGWVDAHLLAAALLTPAASLWSRDQRLASAAEKLGLPPRG